jgi:hypothetical protein
MPRKRPQYRRPPPRPAFVRQGPSDESLDFAASRLAQGATIEDLRLLVTQRRELRDNEDRNANAQPGPEALGRFRNAVLYLAEAERALALLEKATGQPAL